ncbi:uncharacterized protein LOC131327386 [Rhododendron vialii]|uniref:uncharacterized protein LOC131327386 n=1 Tax=Rhododendron vialii TaxID=182163 RepID=UPI00265FDC36|nr:uncharacterized protein LOC131327386 [Rhododendron vialii]
MLRWAFILWLAMQHRLSSVDRLLVWGIVAEVSCVLCNSGNVESHNHLFFDCPYSSAIWADMLTKNQVCRYPMQWDDEMIWFNLHSKGNCLRKSVLKLSLSAAVYGIGREGNARIFQQRSMDSVFASAKSCNSI